MAIASLIGFPKLSLPPSIVASVSFPRRIPSSKISISSSHLKLQPKQRNPVIVLYAGGGNGGGDQGEESILAFSELGRSLFELEKFRVSAGLGAQFFRNCPNDAFQIALATCALFIVATTRNGANPFAAGTSASLQIPISPMSTMAPKVGKGKNTKAQKGKGKGKQVAEDDMLWFVSEEAKGTFDTLKKQAIEEGREGKNLKAISHLKGIHIELDIDVLASMLDVSVAGPCIFWEPMKKFKQLTDVDAIYRDIMVNYTGDTHIKIKQLKPIPHTIAYIIQHNIVPCRGHCESLTSFEAYVTHCVHTMRPLNLPYIILRMMQYALLAHNHALPYGRLITHIFTVFGVDLTGEDCSTEKKNDVRISYTNFSCGEEVANVGAKLADVGAQPTENVESYNTQAQLVAFQQQIDGRLLEMEGTNAQSKGHLLYMVLRMDQIAGHLHLSDLPELYSSSSDSERSPANFE